jgi:hypothetical protein
MANSALKIARSSSSGEWSESCLEAKALELGETAALKLLGAALLEVGGADFVIDSLAHD